MSTDTDPFSDAKIIESWGKNAQMWTAAVRERQIESRRKVTDQAIVETILGYSPRSVLDLGCGEGWLARELSARNIPVIGTDAVQELVEVAQRAGGGDFRVMTYDEISTQALRTTFDVVACNFALLGKESVESVFKTIPALLGSSGLFIVQTLHPAFACGDLAYTEGWREGSWAGFSTAFSDPAPWYFRTFESWLKLFIQRGFRVREIREPLDPSTLKPASVIFVGEVNGAETAPA